MKRREFIAGLGSAVAWPLAARGQQGERVRRVGVLINTVEDDPIGQARLAAFRQSLQDVGWREGRNVRFEYRWAGGDIGRMPAYAAELVGLMPDVILANSTPATAALKQATRSIPIVFAVVNDPVEQGLVLNLARPGENITGFSYLEFSVVGKTMEILKKIAPELMRVGFMFNPESYPYYEVYLRSFLATSNPLALEVIPARVRSDAEIAMAIMSLTEKRGSGLVLPPEPWALVHRQTIITLAAQNRLPAIYGYREAVVEGALMSYAPSQIDIFRRSGAYIDRILKGESAGDLPVQAPTKYELVLNMKAAKALGLLVPPALLALADEVIE